MNTNGGLIHIQWGTYAFTLLCLPPTLIFIVTYYLGLGGFPGSPAGENPPAIQETLVQFLGQEDPLEKG